MAAIEGAHLEALGVEIALGTPDNIQGASYDFRIGDQVYLWSSREMVDPQTTDVMLRRNDIAVIKTHETIKMPNDVCGILVSKVAPHAMGIFHPATSIDPLFEGNMHVALYNMGRYDVPLKWQMDFCTGMFFKMNEATEIPHKRTQDFSRVMEVFAGYIEVIFPGKPEEVPPSVSLEDLYEKTVWKGDPFTSLYAFLAGHDRKLTELSKAVSGYFLLLMVGPWVISALILAVIVVSVDLSFEQIRVATGLVTALNAVVNLALLAGRWRRGRKVH